MEKLRIEREEKQGYARRKHGVQDLIRFEEQYYVERSAKNRGRGTGWQEGYQSSGWGGQSSSSTWHGSSGRTWHERHIARVHIHMLYHTNSATNDAQGAYVELGRKGTERNLTPHSPIPSQLKLLQ
eukprot:3002550-Amphidinium_carterae.1